MAQPNGIRLLRGPPGRLVVTSTLGAAGRTARCVEASAIR
jgi:hypothetical protein